MNLTDGTFLCLDIGSSGVHGVAARISFGRLKSSVNIFVAGSDAICAVRDAVDKLEEQIGGHFDSAFVTGNFGDVRSEIYVRQTNFGGMHKITPADVWAQANCDNPDNNNFHTLHIIPLRYDLSGAGNVASVVGRSDSALNSVFHSVSYSADGLARAKSALYASHLESAGFFDPMFVLGRALGEKNEAIAILDFGAEYTSVSVWTPRGPMVIIKIPRGGRDISLAIKQEFNLSNLEAERLKISVMSMVSNDMDRFTPADIKYDITKYDINNTAGDIFSEIIDQVSDSLMPAIKKYNIKKIYVSGGGSGIFGIDDFLYKKFGLEIKNLGEFGVVNALAEFSWKAEAPRVNRYLESRARWEKFFGFLAAPLRIKMKSRKRRVVRIMPSSLVWDMRDSATYARFNSAGITTIHIDIMDGFYVDKIASGIDELKFIRAHTRDHLHVHLMTENPDNWATDAIAAGADTIILSSETNGVRRAIKRVHAAKRRVGIALNPDTDINVITPILRDIDEVMLMAVNPGASGQGFIPNTLARIRALNAARKKYKLKFRISVDGGINPETATECWRAGADFLVSGSYLKNAPDFGVAVSQLLP
ncbi:MAG: ribulose-phosphate 3-epimerase [Rickettsiales bacterium]|jgi:ribulose-phosphate 3-epimerase|nr:ribulose-phosphate 3-epimerase [Rickettsiales bacterium]